MCTISTLLLCVKRHHIQLIGAARFSRNFLWQCHLAASFLFGLLCLTHLGLPGICHFLASSTKYTLLSSPSRFPLLQGAGPCVTVFLFSAQLWVQRGTHRLWSYALLSLGGMLAESVICSDPFRIFRIVSDKKQFIFWQWLMISSNLPFGTSYCLLQSDMLCNSGETKYQQGLG